MFGGDIKRKTRRFGDKRGEKEREGEREGYSNIVRERERWGKRGDWREERERERI